MQALQAAQVYGSDAWFERTKALLVSNPQVSGFDPFDDKLVWDIWDKKYRFQEEDTPLDTFDRVANGIYANDTDSHRQVGYMAMAHGLWMPGGRIIAGAGTGKAVTLMNCYVNGTLHDSMQGIHHALGTTMFTQQRGGGIGTDFSPIRPEDALIESQGVPASGPLPFIDTFDAAGTTVQSSGSRRAAEMGTISDTHPDMPKFVVAKHQPGRWTNFNVSVLVSDAFMAAVADDEEWLLYFHIPPMATRAPEVATRDFDDEAGVRQYVYSVWKARELWDLILQSTYEYAEPGVIFIDKVNDQNNLKYIETIRCTNPCGEQPLPPNGTCNLGAVNLSRMVRNPFSEDAEFDYDLLRATVQVGVRFLDNVIDVTMYPLVEQHHEEVSKRRIGLGISGLADAMALLGIRYGSARGATFTGKVMQLIAETAYETSMDLAVERGSFPLYDADKWGKDAFFEQRMPPYLQEKLNVAGIRHGILLTIAPTGTTSIFYGNISSGLEPVFQHHSKRKVRQPDNSRVEYDSYGYGSRLWLHLNPGSSIADLPSHMVTTDDVKIHEHLRVQEVCQQWIDASISKTINLPTDISFEDFREVYTTAYESDCKGCTTYRPSDARGSVLTRIGPDGAVSTETRQDGNVKRPEILTGKTVQLKWQALKSSIYLNLNVLDGKPYEVFLMSKDQRHMEWTTTVTLLLSRLMRMGISIESLAHELKQIASTEGGWADGVFYPSLVAYIGEKLEVLAKDLHHSETLTLVLDAAPVKAAVTQVQQQRPQLQCEDCSSYNLTKEEGCLKCKSCGWSKCS